jgi:uncharacterized membrane protein YedE/YeeE
MANRNPLDLKKSEKLLVIIAGVLGIILDTGSSKFIHYIMPYGYDMAVAWEFSRITGNILKAVVFAFLVFRMIKVFRRTDFTLKRIFAIVACVVFVALLIASNIWRYSAVQNINQYFESTNADLNKSDLDNLKRDLSPEKKSRLSFIHAQAIFLNEGRVIEYLSIDGSPIAFTPSSEDQSNRNLVLFRQTYTSFEKKIATTNSFSWLVALIGALGFGFTAKIKKEA